MTETGPSELPDASIVFTTVGNGADGRRLARLLVERRLAACVQLLPIESVYRWDGEVQEDAETLLLIKTPSSSVGRVQAVVVEEHPYETPEVLHVSMDGGLPAYVQWLLESTAS